MKLQNGYQAQEAPRDPIPPAGACSAVQRPESIDHVVAAVVEQPTFPRGSVFDMDAYFAKFKRETHSIPEVM